MAKDRSTKELSLVSAMVEEDKEFDITERDRDTKTPTAGTEEPAEPTVGDLKKSRVKSFFGDERVDVVPSESETRPPKTNGQRRVRFQQPAAASRRGGFEHEILADHESAFIDELAPRVLPQVAASAVMAVNGFRAGFMVAYNAVGIPSFLADPKRPFDLDTIDRSLFAGARSFAGMAGALASGYIGRTFGRKKPLIVLMVPLCLVWLMIAFPVSAIMMVAARMIQGFLNDIVLTLGQLYVSEVSHKSIRGFLLTTTMMWFVLGQLLCFVIAYFVNWRMLALISMIASLVFIPFLLPLPTSPVWLLEQNREEEALQALLWLRGPKWDCMQELNEIKQHMEGAMRRQPTFRTMLKFDYLKPTLLVVVFLILRQLTGYFPTTLFSLSILKDAHSIVEPEIEAIIVGAVAFVFATIACFAVDRLGRRKLIMYSSLITAVGQFGLGTYFHHKNEMLGGLRWLPLAAMVTTVSAFSLGLMTLPYLLIGELVPIQIKSYATGVLFFVSSMFQSASLFTFELSRVHLGYDLTYWFYGLCCMVLFVICVLAMPETRNRSLREIEEEITVSRTSVAVAGGH